MTKHNHNYSEKQPYMSLLISNMFRKNYFLCARIFVLPCSPSYLRIVFFQGKDRVKHYVKMSRFRILKKAEDEDKFRAFD